MDLPGFELVQLEVTSIGPSGDFNIKIQKLSHQQYRAWMVKATVITCGSTMLSISLMPLE
jgi:hypothetical protein